MIIATGQSRTSNLWKNTEITWEELIKRLETTTRTTETQGEYINMTKTKQADIKDVGGFVGGKIKNGRRKAENIDKRYILTLDADFASEDFCDTLELFFDFTWCVYSTHKHTPEKPRLRLLIPLSRPSSPDEYEAVARMTAKEIGIDMFDDTTYQAHRLMYWPSTSIDGEYLFRHEKNKPLNVDDILRKYENWQDVNSWPTSSRTIKGREKLLKKQEDPTAKKGIIGTFCRTYTVDEAIEKFIPDVYTKCEYKNRYTFNGGSTAAGALIYEDGKFLYSNHSTDPVSGMLCNAFDLIRIHKFADLDEDAAEGTPVAKLPSYIRMQEMSASDDIVKITMHNEKMEAAKEDFADLQLDEDTEGSDDSWVCELKINNKGNYLNTIDNIKKIIENDIRLKNRLGYNDFTKRYKILKSVPWNTKASETDWTDTDDAGLRHYIEKIYEIKGERPVRDAWSLVMKANKFHPVKDYLNCLKWDRKSRVDTLFIDYLGADDNQYIKLVTRKTLVAAVARIFEPGVKFDNMLVIVGPQGCGKSEIVKRLGHDWWSDSLDTMKGKEAYEQIQGFWIIEVAELAAMKKIEVESVKHFIAKSEDAYRAAYGRNVETFKRQCIFIGTSNKYEFLKDMTGNRRFWPVDANPENASKNMWETLDYEEVCQVWAEAVELYKKGEKIYLDSEEQQKYAAEEQDRHLEESPLTGDVQEYLEMLLPEDWSNYDLSARRQFVQGGDFGKIPVGTVKREKICTLEVWCELLNGDKKDLTYQKNREICEIIHKTSRWERTKYAIRFGKLYNSQRGFKRLL